MAVVEQRKEGRDRNYRREQVKESQKQTRSRSNTQEGRGRHETCGQGGKRWGMEDVNVGSTSLLGGLWTQYFSKFLSPICLIE